MLSHSPVGLHGIGEIADFVVMLAKVIITHLQVETDEYLDSIEFSFKSIIPEYSL